MALTMFSRAVLHTTDSEDSEMVHKLLPFILAGSLENGDLL
jgi:hypothetical protein